MKFFEKAIDSITHTLFPQTYEEMLRYQKQTERLREETALIEKEIQELKKQAPCNTFTKQEKGAAEEIQKTDMTPAPIYQRCSCRNS